MSSNSRDSRSTSAASDDEEMLKAVGNVKKLSATEIKSLREASVETIAKTDVVVQDAVDAFFDNRTVDCVTLLDEHKHADPLVMTGAGLIAFVRYVLSMEQEHADTAIRDINEGAAFSTQIAPKGKGVFSKLGGAFRSKNQSVESTWLKPGEFRAKTIHTESQALRAFVLVLQGNVLGYIKAGLALRNAYQGYTALLKEREEREAHARAALCPDERKKMEGKEIDIGLDRNSIYSVDFGLGAMNIAISILPDSVVRMIKVMGMEGDRGLGIRLARRCFDSQTLLSSFASGMLLGLLGTLPLTCSLLVGTYSPVIRNVVDGTLARGNTNNSLMHLWLVARAELITRDLDRVDELMERCAKLSEEPQVKKGMPQLRVFVYHDRCSVHIIRHEWKKAWEAFHALSKDCKWSELFYNYAQACCYEAMAHMREKEGASAAEVDELYEKAAQQYWFTIHQKATKMGGKVRATDQLVAKRLDEMLAVIDVPHPNRDYKDHVKLTPMPKGKQLRNTVPMAAYEIAFLYNYSLRIPNAIMKKMVANIDDELVRLELVAGKTRKAQPKEEAEHTHKEEAEPVKKVVHKAEHPAKKPDVPSVESDEVAEDELTASRSTATEDAARGLSVDFVEDEKDAVHAHPRPRASHVGVHDGHSKGGVATTATPEQVIEIDDHVKAIHAASAAYKGETTTTPGALPSNYLMMILSGIKACFLANSEVAEEREDGVKLIDAILEAPQYKDKAWSISFVQPFLLYEKACVLYHRGDEEGHKSCEQLMKDYEKKYSDTHYYFHSAVEFRLHLAKYHLKHKGAEVTEKENAAGLSNTMTTHNSHSGEGVTAKTEHKASHHADPVA